jgi:hypothetical protein
MARNSTTAKSLGMPLRSQPVVEIIVCCSFMFINLLYIFWVLFIRWQTIFSMVKRAGLYSGFATSLDVNNVGKQSLFLFYWHIVESLFFLVPVFDTRGTNLFILPTDQGISDILPAFHEEPPKESII